MAQDQQPPEADPVSTALAEWRQGDFVLDAGLCVHLADLRTPMTAAARQQATEVTEAKGELGLAAVVWQAPGLVVVSQTCDIVRPWGKRPFLELAALVEVDQGTFGHVRRGRTAHYAYVPALEHLRLVADLDRIVTVEKAIVAPWQRQVGCQTDDQRRAFARALARKRFRFAFPDEFVEAVTPLARRLKDHYGQNSPEGIMIDALREIRVQASPHWGAEQTALVFFFIRESDAEIEDQAWDQQASDWCSLIELPASYSDVLSVVIELGDMAASDYVGSDMLDFDHISELPIEG